MPFYAQVLEPTIGEFQIQNANSGISSHKRQKAEFLSAFYETTGFRVEDLNASME